MTTDDPLILFGKNLRKIRKKLEVSQEELAHNANLDRTFISTLERGLKNPSLKTILKIAQALRISPKDLLDF